MIDANARDFERGRDLAIEMLAEADRLMMGEREGLRRFREGGKAQDNVMKRYLADIINEPALIDGFSSVLSVAIRGDIMPLSELREITLAETQADADDEAFQVFMLGLRGDAPPAVGRTSE